MSVTITGPQFLIEPQLPNGQPNQLFSLAAYLAVRATGHDNDINVDVINGQARITGISDVDAIRLPTLQALVAAGAEVEGYPVWIERTAAQMDAAVPEYLPNAKDKEDDKQTRKWSAWNDGKHSPYQAAGKSYVPGNSWGDELKGSVISQLIAASVPLKTLSEMRAIVAANSPAKPT